MGNGCCKTKQNASKKQPLQSQAPGVSVEILTFTDAQLAAQRQAAMEIQTIAEAADRAPVNTRPRTYTIPECMGKRGSHRGGIFIEELMQHTDLVDARYLLALAKAGGIVPRWQEIPEAARINKKNAWRLRSWNPKRDRMITSLPVLVWSYCWLSKSHPDPTGEQLRNCLYILEAMVSEAMQTGGEHATVGVLQDFCSYPQKPYRTEAEKKRFQAGLYGELNLWYSHPNTHVLVMDIPAMATPKHTNTKTYMERGWCWTELRLSSVIKDDDCLLMLSRGQGKEINAYVEVLAVLKGGRPPLMSPSEMAKQMREKVSSERLSFTSSADMSTVIDLYESAFKKCFKELRDQLPVVRECGSSRDSSNIYRYVFYNDLGWGDDEADVIEDALRYIVASFQVEDAEEEQVDGDLGCHDPIENDDALDDLVLQLTAGNRFSPEVIQRFRAAVIDVSCPWFAPISVV